MRATRLLALPCIGLLALGGCSAGSAPQDPTSGAPTTGASSGDTAGETTDDGGARWTPVHGDSALPEETVRHVTDGLDHPDGALLAGWTAEPGRGSRAALLAPDDPASAVELPAGEGSTAVEVAAVLGRTSVLAGTRWRDGVRHPFLLTTTGDPQRAEDWQPRELPAAVTDSGLHPRALVQGADGPVLLGPDAADRLVAASAAGLRTLPGGAGLEQAHAANGPAGAVLVAPVSGGVRVWGSSDGMRWRRYGDLPGAEPRVSDLTAVRGGVVATGSVATGLGTRPAAWFSSDGRRWRTESVPAWEEQDGWDSRLGRAGVSDGALVVAHERDSSLDARLLRRAPDGTWSWLAFLGAGGDAGLSVLVAGDDAGVHAVRQFQGRLTVTGYADGRHDVSSTDADDPVAWWSSVVATGGYPLLVGSRYEVEAMSNGWSRETSSSGWVVNGTALGPGDWEPGAAGDWSGQVSATAEDGTVVTAGDRIGRTLTANATDVAAQRWDPERRTWQPTEGLGGARTEFVTDLVTDAGTWVLVGTEQASFNGAEPTTGALWSSGDGRTWQRGKLPRLPAPSTLSSACRLPDGGWLAVGRAGSGAGSRALALRHPAAAADGTLARAGWRRAEVQLGGAGPRTATALTHCRSVADGILVQGTVGDRATAWRSTDGRRFTEVDGLGGSAVTGYAERYGEVLLLPGVQRRGAADRPVLWWSTDATTWRALPVPTEAPATVEAVHGWGDRLVLALSGPGGHSAMLLENPAEALTG